MILESRKLEQIQLRHLEAKRSPAANFVVWWFGAVHRNTRDNTLPLVAVWIRKLLPDGSLGPIHRIDVGITELALLQIGTIWNDGYCRNQILLEEREVSVNFSPSGWQYTSQARSDDHARGGLIPPDLYPLYHGRRDRSELIVFNLREGRRLLVPSLEFFSRCYGRSAEVNRVLSTYRWSEAESRLHLPLTEAVPAGQWAVCLPANIYNDDATLVSHLKYDNHAQFVAKSIYSNLESQFDEPSGLAFPQIGPWFTGPAELVVQGIPLDQNRFLALRIVGGSEPNGPPILSFRENPGEADNRAPDGASQSSWAGSRSGPPGDIQPLVSVTPTDPASHGGSTVEILNPSFRIVGTRRTVMHQKLHNAKTRPGPQTPNQKSDKHSPGERQGTDETTGKASIHTETQLEPHGAVRDVWEALLYLRATCPELIEDVGWYSSQSESINFADQEPSIVALSDFNDAHKRTLSPTALKWVYIDREQTRLRGVLIAFVKTPTRSAYLFEIERRIGQRTSEDGTTCAKEQSLCGLIVSPPQETVPTDWIQSVLEGIRDHEGIMARVATNCCPGFEVTYYRRSNSKEDKVAGHSTVIKALAKINIDVPRTVGRQKQQGGRQRRSTLA